MKLPPHPPYSPSPSRVSQKISNDKAARKAKQNQEWGTTRNQNPESNPNNSKQQKNLKTRNQSRIS
jgi:hypothetical protein